MESSESAQRMMNHSIAECTICSFKGLSIALVYGFFKSEGAKPSESEISEDEKIIKIKLKAD